MLLYGKSKKNVKGVSVQFSGPPVAKVPQYHEAEGSTFSRSEHPESKTCTLTRISHARLGHQTSVENGSNRRV